MPGSRDAKALSCPCPTHSSRCSGPVLDPASIRTLHSLQQYHALMVAEREHIIWQQAQHAQAHALAQKTPLSPSLTSSQEDGDCELPMRLAFGSMSPPLSPWLLAGSSRALSLQRLPSSSSSPSSPTMLSSPIILSRTLTVSFWPARTTPAIVANSDSGWRTTAAAMMPSLKRRKVPAGDKVHGGGASSGGKAPKGRKAARGRGELDAWTALTDEEKVLRDIQVCKELYRHFGERAWKGLTPEEQFEAEVLVWCGCGRHKEMNSVKGGVEGMKLFWESIGGLAPIKLMNKANDAAVKKSVKGSAVAENALEASEGGGRDDKRGQQDTFKLYFEHVLRYSVSCPDTSNTRFQSHCDCAIFIILYLPQLLLFMSHIMYSKGKLAVLALYSNSVSYAYMRVARATGDRKMNALDLADFHAKVIRFCKAVAENPDLLLAPDASNHNAKSKYTINDTREFLRSPTVTEAFRSWLRGEPRRGIDSGKDRRRRLELIEHENVVVEEKKVAEAKRKARAAELLAELQSLKPLLDADEIAANHKKITVTEIVKNINWHRQFVEVVHIPLKTAITKMTNG
ncbi:hypothetical protein K438DRAFT_2027077 [Mycena galopus ATCC 62051]|nr:hypothetical protein K438DRAFT_2027077 [Mycena galopus ATCC 62051]